jgi:hypothetical protein
MSEAAPVYLIVEGKSDEEPFFDAERLTAFYKKVNDAFSPDYQGERFETPPGDEYEIAAHIGLYAILSEKPLYTAKTAFVVTSYLQGFTPLQNVKGAHKKFQTYHKDAEPVGLYMALNPKNSGRFMTNEQASAVYKIRKLIEPTPLLDVRDRTLSTREKARLQSFTDDLDPLTAYNQEIRVGADAGDPARAVPDLYNALFKCAKYFA